MSNVADLVMVADAITLQKAQEFVDGYVEVLHLKDGTQMLVNEDGQYQENLLPNPIATEIAINGGYRVSTQGIKGNAIILTGAAVWT